MTNRGRGVASAGTLVFTLLLCVPGTGLGQEPVTVEDYGRAESRLGTTMSPLVYGARVAPNWLDGDRFWYANRTAQGNEFLLVDPERGTRGPAFDHEGVAGALSSVSGTTYSARELPFNSFTYIDGGDAISFQTEQGGYVCETDGSSCRRDAAAAAGGRRGGAAGGGGGRGGGPGGGGAEVASPDGTRAAFIRENDLWMRDVASGQETRLTTDGVEDFGYGTNNAGWTKSDRPVLVWSPDSRRIATFQHDARGVGDMYLVSTEVGHPTLEAWKYPLPEDSVIFRIHRVVIDVEGPSVVRLDMPPDPHRSTACDHVYCGGTWADVEWSSDGSQLAFVSTSRDHKDEYFRIADPVTGAVRDVMEEHVETFFESGYSGVNWRFMPETNELLWYSQRSDWGHLYLYDLTTGGVKSQVTSGDWNVLGIEYFDRDERRLLFTGAGREPGDPYFQYFYRVDLDGSDLRLLTPDSANHSVTLTPSKRYFIDSYSTPVTPPVTVVRDMDGDVVVELEEADISELVAAGWQAPIPFSVKARDGVTDLYGLMYRPSNFDPTRSYPVVNYLYPGPQSGSVGSRSFSPARGDKQAIAELGFIVVEVDAMGTPMRSKSFHEAYYGNMGDNGLPDQMTMIEQLAERHEWMDASRVGIWGHSGGGFAAADAIMRYPDFYDVAVSQAGNHDNRNYEDDWGEKWQGLLEEYPDGATNYDNQANHLLAENLKGKLLIAHGTMDSNVPPSNTMLVVNALIEANKDFDLILFPNRRHGFGNETYMMRRRWDYFVKHLLGVEPPEYEIGRRPIS